MLLQYIEYEDELQKLYNRSNNFGNGSCIEVHGLPGIGLGLFIDSYIRKYESVLKMQQNICCCVIHCPKDHPKRLFEFIAQKITNLFSRELERRSLTKNQKVLLWETRQYCDKITKMSGIDEVPYSIFSESVLELLGKCKKLCNIINIRLIIKDFDHARNLFLKDVNYAMLFKEMCEEHTNWLGVIVTSHRTVTVISLIVDSFSEFASLFSHITITGFNEWQMEKVFTQMEEKLRISLNKRVRDRILYFCGNNPQRLEILFTSLNYLKIDFMLYQTAEEWERLEAEKLIEKAYQCCEREMNEHLDRIIRMVRDLKGDGLLALKNAINVSYSNLYYEMETREPLFQMQVLKSQKNINGKVAIPAIPVLKDVVEDIVIQVEKEVPEYIGILEKKEENCSMRFLHLSDLHFGFEEEETEEEMRKNYIYDFWEELKKILSKRKIDYIFVTGDIGWKARINDYTKAEKFLHELLDICGLDVDSLFLCPGNHDVDQSFIEDLEYPSNQKKADKFFELGKLDKHTEAFQNYNKLCERLRCQPYKISKYTSYLTGIRFCENIAVICLNTAWFAKDKEQSKKVWVGKNYIVTIKNMINEYCSTLKKDKKPLCITLMHHPEKYWEEQECSNYSETTNAWRMVSQISDVVLCGHTHEIADLENEVNSARIFRGGAFYEKTSEPNSFCVYEVIKGKYSKERHIYRDGSWLCDSL